MCQDANWGLLSDIKDSLSCKNSLQFLSDTSEHRHRAGPIYLQERPSTAGELQGIFSKPNQIKTFLTAAAACEADLHTATSGKSLTSYIPYILLNSLNLPTQCLPSASHLTSTYPNHNFFFLFHSLMEMPLRQWVQFSNAATKVTHTLFTSNSHWTEKEINTCCHPHRRWMVGHTILCACNSHTEAAASHISTGSKTHSKWGTCAPCLFPKQRNFGKPVYVYTCNSNDILG